jgi:hypothetical protein
MRRYNNWYYYVVVVCGAMYDVWCTYSKSMVGMHYHREVHSTDSYTINRENVVL